MPGGLECPGVVPCQVVSSAQVLSHANARCVGVRLVPDGHVLSAWRTHL